MGCGASKDDIAEPQPVQSHGRDNLQLTRKAALKPIQVTSGISALYISSSVINNPASPPCVSIHSPDSLSSDEDDSDLDSSYEFPSHLSIEEVEENVSRTTALAALSGEKTQTDKGDVEERVEAILAADQVLSIEHNPECSTCPLGMLSGAAVVHALMSTVPVITQQNFDGDLSQARVGRVAVISEPEPIPCEVPLRKAEIIDLDEEPDVGEKLMLENTHESEEDQSDTDEEPLEPAEPAEPAKVAGEPPVPAVFEAEQFEDLSARTPDVAALESANGDNHDMSKSSPVTEQCETPTPATKSPADSEWRSLHRDTPDPDIEDIVLLESQELDSLPLLPMLDCHGIHSDNKDLISPSLRLIS